MEEFSSTVEAISEYTIFPESFLLPAFQVIQQFKSLPDFLMFPTSWRLPPPNREIIYAMNVFTTFASEAHKRSRLASDALHYACHHCGPGVPRAGAMHRRAYRPFPQLSQRVD
ncbi:hypothetical protein BDR03DRAFT_970340 [Suillus americanus]|nr:hypothetical protein BDR03DRAFT_970340 [Suillus americanus]